MGSPPNRDGPSSSSSSTTTGAAAGAGAPLLAPRTGDLLRCPAAGPVEPLLSFAAAKLARFRLGVRLSSALGDVAPGDGRSMEMCVLGRVGLTYARLKHHASGNKTTRKIQTQQNCTEHEYRRHRACFFSDERRACKYSFCAPKFTGEKRTVQSYAKQQSCMPRVREHRKGTCRMELVKRA